MADRKTANRANVKSYEIILIARSYFLIIRYTGEINNLYHHTFWWNWRFIPQNIFSTSRDFLDFFFARWAVSAERMADVNYGAPGSWDLVYWETGYSLIWKSLKTKIYTHGEFSITWSSLRKKEMDLITKIIFKKIKWFKSDLVIFRKNYMGGSWCGNI